MPSTADAPPPYGTIVFDCDSTLATIEGIDELAALRPSALAEVSALTARAMAGELSLEEVYGRRLGAIRPSRAEVDAIGAAYVRAATPGGHALVAALRSLGKRVAVVSGGLLSPVRTLASHLGIDDTLVFAVETHHDGEGAYVAFDGDSPLARAGGKIEVLTDLATRPGAGPVALVGDGATDLEAAPVCARFVAYAGVEHREAVLAAAAVTCEDPDLSSLLPLLTTADERATLAADPAHAPLFEHPTRT